MRHSVLGALVLSALSLAGAANAKDPKPATKPAPAAPTISWENDRDGYKGLRAKLRGLRATVVEARRSGDDKAEALALTRLADVYTRLNNRTEASELLLRANLLARRLEDTELAAKVTRQIRDIW